MQRFATIEGWVFDLDNTLYPASQNLFAQIDKRMTAFIGEALAVERDKAYRLQKQFLGEYGTTLAGLMNKHGLPPGPFLDFVHDIDVSPLTPDPKLSNALANLPGKKYIFTNGTQKHAERVSDRLGVLHHFDDIFDIVSADFIPKPSLETYKKIIEKYKIEPQYSIFIEDIARNLKPAHELGMKTVWIINDEPWAAEFSNSNFINYRTDKLSKFLKEINESK